MSTFMINARDNFPSGFTSWMETFYEIVRTIEQLRDSDNMPLGITEVQENHGHCGFYTLASELTDEFEHEHEGWKWGQQGGLEDFIDEVYEFCVNHPRITRELQF